MVRALSTAKKEKLLSTALRLFASRGVTNISTAEIAREAGIASGTLFLYFPTRQALLDELVILIAQQQAAYIRTLLHPSLSARESFSAVWRGTVSWFLEHMDAYLYVQQVRDSGLISQAAVEESGKSLGYYFEAIAKGLAEGSIKTYPPELMGDFLYQDFVAVMNTLRRQPDSSRAAETIRQGFDIFWDGIKSG